MAAGEDLAHAVAGQSAGQGGEDQRHQAEDDEADDRDEGRLGAQKDRDRDDRAELSPGAGSHEEGSEAGVQLAAVAQDRQQRAEGCRRQGDCDAEGVLDLAGDRHDDRRNRGDPEREEPSHRREPAALAADGTLLELHACEEEEQAETELRQQVDGLVDRDPAQDLRSEHDPGTEQQHHLRDLDAEQPDDQWHKGGDGRDHHQGLELLGHGLSSGGRTMRSSAVSSLGVPMRAPSTACSSGFWARMVVT